jgi:hypothetical protein
MRQVTHQADVRVILNPYLEWEEVQIACLICMAYSAEIRRNDSSSANNAKDANVKYAGL